MNQREKIVLKTSIRANEFSWSHSRLEKKARVSSRKQSRQVERGKRTLVGVTGEALPGLDSWPTVGSVETLVVVKHEVAVGIGPGLLLEAVVTGPDLHGNTAMWGSSGIETEVCVVKADSPVTAGDIELLLSVQLVVGSNTSLHLDAGTVGVVAAALYSQTLGLVSAGVELLATCSRGACRRRGG